jgi:hypothetical protein
MQSLSTILSPRAEGLTPYRVRFQRLESALVPSMTDEGVRYQHPATEQEAIVWAKDEAGIPPILNYHYRDTWHSLRVLTHAEVEQEVIARLHARRTP